jgi:hypothetical protein
MRLTQKTIDIITNMDTDDIIIICPVLLRFFSDLDMVG